MRVLLILAVLLAVATAVYHLMAFRERRAADALPWRVLIDPRPLHGARLTALGVWGGVLGAAAGLLLLSLADTGP